MSSDIEFAQAAPAPDRLGQGTAVEQSRAVAVVQAQVLVAWQRPRDPKQARERMLEACSHLELADDAFYAYPRGGETVTGMTVVAAVELATCWGNIDYGLTEMRRDDVYGQSEMLAFAWDMETNVRHAHTFIVQHKRSTKTGTYKLTEPRDIYELNTNDGSRRMRESILKTLPRWYRSEAEKALKATLLKEIGAESIEQGRERAIQFFRGEFGVGRGQLEFKLRKPVDKWKANELIELRILGQSIKKGQLRPEEAFASAKVTREELAEDARAPRRAPADRRPPAKAAPAAPDALTADQIESGLRDAIETATTKAERDAAAELAREHEAAGRISYDQYDALLDLLHAKVRAAHPGSTGHYVVDDAKDEPQPTDAEDAEAREQWQAPEGDEP